MEYIRIKNDLTISETEFKSLSIVKRDYNYSIILFTGNEEITLFSYDSYEFVHDIYEEFLEELFSDKKVKHLKTDGLWKRARDYSQTVIKSTPGVQSFYAYEE